LTCLDMTKLLVDEGNTDVDRRRRYGSRSRFGGGLCRTLPRPPSSRRRLENLL